MEHIIILDIGTSSMRATLYGADGASIYSSAYEYHSEYLQDARVEQDPATWLRAAVSTLGKVGSYLREKNLSAEAVAVTSQRSSLIPVAADGEALCSAIMWQDKRTIGECEILQKEYGLSALYHKTGLRINPYFVLPKIMWLRRNLPDLYRKAARFVGVQDYVAHHLTGEFVTDWTQASRTMLMNIRDFQWDPDLLSIAEIGADRLPGLVAPGSAIGGITKQFARDTGISEGTPVILCGGDQQNAMVGLGVVRPGLAEANTGTGSFVLSYAERPVFDEDCRVLCQASAIAGKWVAEAGIFNTGAIYRWFKEQFCADFQSSEAPYPLMDREAAGSPEGSNGVMLLPHFQGSAAPYWNPMAKGMFFNLSLGTSRADMMRSILEGISLEIFDNLTLIQALSGNIQDVSVAGGMTKSDLFCTIQANVYNKRIVRFCNAEATSLGAAIVAGTQLGAFRDVEEGFRVMTGGKSICFMPDAARVAVYAHLLERKRKLYEALNESGVYREFMA